MSRRKLAAYIDALVAGRRPRRFRADADEAAVVRTAIELRAARSSEAAPDEQFVSRLYQELAEQHQTPVMPAARPIVTPILRPVARPRGRMALVGVAAALALVGGTVVTTEAVDHPASRRAALPVPQGQELRTGTFEDASSRVLGQIVVYGGNPSWVFMDVNGSHYDGVVTCHLQASSGATVMTGTFDLLGGTGELDKAIRVDVGGLRGAELVTSTGATLASATFS
jgi:hypothetical protein